MKNILIALFVLFAGSAHAQKYLQENGTFQPVAPSGVLNLLCTTSGAFPIYNATTGAWVCSTVGGAGSLATLIGTFNLSGLYLTPPSGLTTGIQTLQNMTGTTAGAPSANLIQIASDNANVGANFLVGLNISDTVGDPAMYGGRIALQTSLAFTAPSALTSAGNTNHSYVGHQINAVATSSDNGTNTGAGSVGGIFTEGIVAVLQAGATNWVELTGGEIDIGMDSTASTKYMLGHSVVAGYNGGQNGAGTAANFGAGYNVSAIVSRTLDSAFIVSDINSAWPVKTTGTLQKAYIQGATPTVANGTDWSSVTFTGSAFKSSGFSVGGTGAVTGTGYTAGASVGLSTTKTVRAAGGASDCTLIFTGGLLTGGSC